MSIRGLSRPSAEDFSSIISHSEISVKGTQRPQNQDALLIDKINSFCFFAVADGLGGLCNGDKASNLAISTMKKEINQGNIDVKNIIQKAHEVIRQDGEQNQKTMATTIVFCRIDQENGEVTIGHVGDSRAYIMTGELWRTKDHSPVQDLINLGILSEEDAVDHPELHRMTQALGIRDNVLTDCYSMTIQKGTILLCSDGLHNYVKDTVIQDIAMKNSPEKAADLLMKKAQKNGSTDDITIICIKIDGLEQKNYRKKNTS